MVEAPVNPNHLAIDMAGIVKQFPKVLANDHVDLHVQEGEIHAIVGENGAGKSTLMNILYGLYKPDDGTIRVNGTACEFQSPNDAIRKGIGMVHQHFMLVPPLTVTENIVLGMEPLKKLKVFDFQKAKKLVKEISQKYNLFVDPTVKIEDIPVGAQQRVEILKTLYRGADILILDEPTAVLTPQETEKLFEVLRLLQNNGKTIIFITHKLNEVMAISNQVTVMRQGKVTANMPTSQTNPRELAKYMVGREVLLRVSKKARDPGKEVMKVENLTVLDNRKLEAVKNLSFSVRAGEIVGIAGVAGNGQTELVEAIAGLRKPQSGKIWLQGADIAGLNPKEIRELGLSHIPEDRLKHALIKPFPVYYNMLLGRHDQSPFAKHGFLQNKSIQKMAHRLVEAFDVRPKSTDILGGNLSGGNQQKAIVAREIDMNPTIMLVAQPTRGLDIGAIEYIHKTLLEMRNADVGMLLVSMELEEVFSLSDRILVIYEGTIMGEVRPEETNFEEVGYMMAGNPASEVLAGQS